MAVNIVVKVHDQLLREKIALIAPRVLLNNRLMASAIMDEVKGVVVAATPEGPGHFGYHGRDTVRVEITSAGWKTTAKLKGAMQIYWREYGTRGHFRKGNTIKRYMRLAQQGEGGEPAFMVAHKAMGFAKRFVAFYYGKWWNG